MTTELKRTVEALLFAAPGPLSVGRLQSLIGERKSADLKSALTQLREDYDAAGHAFMLREIAGGWRIMTRPDYSRIIEEMLKGQRRVRLSKAAFEVLAVIAYRQPCTRTDSENVRGVNCGGPLATLHERGLVRVTGRAETLGRPLLYATTEEFLAHLGINKLHDLPRMNEIEALLSDGENGDGESSPEDHRESLLENAAGIDDMIAHARGNGNGNGGDPEAERAAAEIAEDDGDDEEEAETADEAEDAEALAVAMRAEYEAEREALAAVPEDEGGAGDRADEALEEILEEREP